MPLKNDEQFYQAIMYFHNFINSVSAPQANTGRDNTNIMSHFDSTAHGLQVWLNQLYCKQDTGMHKTCVTRQCLPIKGDTIFVHQAGAALSVTNIMVSLSALTIVYRYFFFVPDSVSHVHNLMTLEINLLNFLSARV